MYNTETKQQGEWVTIEGMEFLEVNGGGYIKKSEVGDEWVEFDSQAVAILEDLIHAVKSGDEDSHFLVVSNDDHANHVLGFQMSNMIMLSAIEALTQHFTQGDPLKAMLLMITLQDVLAGGDDE